MTTCAITFSKKPTRKAAPFRVTLQSTMSIEQRLGSFKQTTRPQKTQGCCTYSTWRKKAPTRTFQPSLNHFGPF